MTHKKIDPATTITARLFVAGVLVFYVAVVWFTIFHDYGDNRPWYCEGLSADECMAAAQERAILGLD